jgi:hypothetical protein
VFCRQTVNDLRQVAMGESSYPPLLFFHQGTVEDGEAFFGSYWPEARAVSDTERVFYQAFGLQQGTVGQLITPGVFACAIRAAWQGHRQGKTLGDPKQMPGLFLVEGQRVRWQHDFSHAGDHPDWARLPAQAGLV